MKQEPCNGDDNLFELNEDISIKGADTSEVEIRLFPTQTEERQLTMLENMVRMSDVETSG